ncbi:MAG: response regulator, partial [Deltaproteobacteria bacterium]|nr:response regulator [Deltaproteobacteria bacterium]
RLIDELYSSRHYLSAILNNTDLPIYLKTADFKYILVNREYERLAHTTQQEIVGKTDFDIFPEPVAKLFRLQDEEVIRDRRSKGFEETIPLPGGVLTFLTSKFPVENRLGEIYAVGGVCTDITDKMRRERELQKMQKMESVGILAGGIAHDFNNLLTAILGNISMAERHADPSDRNLKQLSDARKAALRAQDLTHQLLTFSKGGEPVKSTIALNAVIEEASAFATTGSNARCVLKIASDLPAVDADEGQLGQVIQNIVKNAAEAMPTGGEIIIEATSAWVGSDDPMPIQEGRYVKISVQDGGTGIPAEHLPRVFEPYFSTKTGGSGLGLAASFSIIKNHDGFIQVDSSEHVDTIFKIYLPVSGKLPVREQKKPRPSICHGRRILVMDDDPLVRDVVREMLMMLGCRVETTEHGVETIERYKEAMDHGLPFDGVILDLTIPGGMGGLKTIKQLKKLDRDVNAIVCSGYANDPVLSNHVEYGFKGVVAKPYDINKIEEAIGNLLP